MRLSTKSEYALLALLDLAENYGTGYIKTSEICSRQGIPKKYLEQIFLTLKGAGYLKSKRGNEGGYILSRSPEYITLAEIIRLLDGPLASVMSASQYFYERSPIEKKPSLVKIFRDIRDYIAQKLENTTLAELL